jgi:superfamily II DNA or RNA helicase/HKD family nuclease/predicted house-cleaning noncanonical NTP pyrophosphatase (MazG superfamily)
MPEKLVRDRIPELPRVEDQTPLVWRTAGPQEWDRLLGLKLVEETHEVLQALGKGSNEALIDELADLQTLIDAVAARRGITREAIEKRVRQKRAERGGFNQGVVLNIAPPREARLHVGGSSSLIDALRQEFAACAQARIAVAFVMQSGLDLLEAPLRAAMLRGAHIRLLTTDYLGVTQPQALHRLASWSAHLPGRLQTRAYSHPRRSFHPKAWLFERADSSGRAFIGSSNLSRSGLRDGVEWTWTVLDVDAGLPMDEIRARFDELFGCDDSHPIDGPWIDAYAARREQMALQAEAKDPTFSRTAPKVGDTAPPQDQDHAPGQPDVITPRPVQQLALAELERLRADGETRALVVAATGLGKTFLAAFDAADARRVLFIAHREELLLQAARAFAAVYPDRSQGFVLDGRFEIDADCVFASVQTLARPEHLNRIPPHRFDHVVIDEFHHAGAASYRRVIDTLQPDFLLGLTATPYRADQRDLLELCHGNLAYQVGLFEAIGFGWLVPFRYFGIADVVQYDNSLLQGWSDNASEQQRKRIEREGRYDIAKLTLRFNTEARVAKAISAFRAHASRAALGFCVSIDHARFMAEQFNRAGIAAAAVHSASDSLPRSDAIKQLSAGTLRILFTVDLFNEGVDIPPLDLVMFLRPTESMTVFLQQLGRGLRLHEGKPFLTVLDFIGNHRRAHFKLPMLIGAEDGSAARDALRVIVRWQSTGQRPDGLPEGIEISFEDKAREVLKESLRAGEGIRDQVIADLQEIAGRGSGRLLLQEYLRLGRFSRTTVMRALNLSSEKRRWSKVLQAAGLMHTEDEALEALAGDFLMEIENTPMTRSFKMVVLLAFFEQGLRQSMPVADMVGFFRRYFSQQRHEADVLGTPVEPVLSSPLQTWSRYLRDNPVNAWVGGNRGQASRFFSFDADAGILRLSLPELAKRPDMHRPLVDAVLDRAQARLIEYWRRPGPGRMVFPILPLGEGGRAFCIMFGEHRKEAGLPEGWHLVRINGEVLYGKFVKVALNVLKNSPIDDRSQANRLTEKLTRLFGGSLPSRARVRLVKDPGAQLWDIQIA